MIGCQDDAAGLVGCALCNGADEEFLPRRLFGQAEHFGYDLSCWPYKAQDAVGMGKHTNGAQMKGLMQLACNQAA